MFSTALGLVSSRHRLRSDQRFFKWSALGYIHVNPCFTYLFTLPVHSVMLMLLINRFGCLLLRPTPSVEPEKPFTLVDGLAYDKRVRSTHSNCLMRLRSSRCYYSTNSDSDVSQSS